VLASDDHAGTPLRVRGLVSSDAGCAPLEGAVLDVWQADAGGGYGAEGERPERGLRGRLRTGRDGAYAFETVVPGPYPDEGHMRPAHIHLKVAHDRHAPLTTQLFFAGDPFLYEDPHVRPGLIRPLERRAAGSRGGLECRFDIVLRRLGGFRRGR
jgi:protocatechuate 3,4-dioxygenase beta subunit